MTSRELKMHLNSIYGLDKKWPEEIVVDHETYANVCQDIFDHMVKTLEIQPTTYPNIIEICVGKRNGLMFKNVELILGIK